MDFLGFLEGKRIFLEYLNKRKLPLFCRPHGIPGSQLRPGLPVARCVASDSERRAAPDPGDPSAATRACGPNCAQGFLSRSGDVGAAGSVKVDGGASGLAGGGGLGAWVAGVQGVPARASRVGG
jgi:hypothetical protein